MKVFFCLLILTITLTSCTEAEDANLNTSLDIRPELEELRVGEITHVETLFNGAEFNSVVEYDLLKELNVCDTLALEKSTCASCTPEHFEIYPFTKGKELKDAFMLQVKALTVMKGQELPLPMRHLIVFERENGGLVKVNGFRGNLIATRESESGVKDLIIRFYIPNEGAFMNCLFIWGNGKYKFESVEAIDGAGGNGSVKASVKAAVSKEVYQTLMSSAMLF